MGSVTKTSAPVVRNSSTNSACWTGSWSRSGSRHWASSTNRPTVVGVRTNTLRSGETMSGVPQPLCGGEPMSCELVMPVTVLASKASLDGQSASDSRSVSIWSICSNN